jgi:polysaccharide pyruvyl transferase WcaK-like protein
VSDSRQRRSRRNARVGVFGLLGSGNLGNDGSLEVVLNYLRRSHSDSTIDAMCVGATKVENSYGIGATPLYCATRFQKSAFFTSTVGRVLGKLLDVFRIAAWVRQHGVVIVPGMGVLETSLPLRFWQDPYALFWLCLFGRVFRTKVALVSVGASEVNQWSIRVLLNFAARFCFYVSYRDNVSLEAMRQRGVDTSRHHVYPDLVYGYPVPSDTCSDDKTVGVGVMAYSGGNDDRNRASELNEHYTSTMRTFLLWLVDSGYQVRLLTGDTKADDPIIWEMRDDIYRLRPGLASKMVEIPSITSMSELVNELSGVGSVVATRFHNVLCALMLGKPTIAVGYSAKHRSAMEDLGMSSLCHSPEDLDAQTIIEQFRTLDSLAAEFCSAAKQSRVSKSLQLDEQFELLSSLLFSPKRSVASPPPVLGTLQDHETRK